MQYSAKHRFLFPPQWFDTQLWKNIHKLLVYPMTVAGTTTSDLFTFAFLSSYHDSRGCSSADDWWWWWRRMSEYFPYPRLHKADSQFLTSHYLNHSLWHDAAPLSLLPQHLGGNKTLFEAEDTPSSLPTTLLTVLPPPSGEGSGWENRGGRGQSGPQEAGRTVLRLSGKKVESEKIPEWTIGNE